MKKGFILPEADLTVIFQDLIEAVKLSSHRICDAPFLIMILFIINRLSECFHFRPRMWKLIGFCVDIEPAVCFGTSIIFDLHLIREKMSHGQISPVCSVCYSETRTHIHWVHLFMLHEKNEGDSTKRSVKQYVWCLYMWIYKSEHNVLYIFHSSIKAKTISVRWNFFIKKTAVLKW